MFTNRLVQPSTSATFEEHISHQGFRDLDSTSTDRVVVAVTDWSSTRSGSRHGDGEPGSCGSAGV